MEVLFCCSGIVCTGVAVCEAHMLQFLTGDAYALLDPIITHCIELAEFLSCMKWRMYSYIALAI